MMSLGRIATLLILIAFFGCKEGGANRKDGGEVGNGGTGGEVGNGGIGGEVGNGGTGGEVGTGGTGGIGGTGGQPVEVAIEIEPTSRTVRQGETVQFTATVTGTDEPAVTWSATGGEISAEGLFTAPEAAGVYTIVATAVADPTKSASATVEVPLATGLSYTDPATGGWRLVKNADASTPARLVLDLVGPEGESGRGVELVLATEPAESVWAQVDPDSDRVRNVAFDLGSEPQLLATHEDGGTLRAGVFQKGDAASPAAYSGPLVSVALELAPGATVASGTPLSLTVERASELPDAGALRPVLVEIGTLAAE